MRLLSAMCVFVILRSNAPASLLLSILPALLNTFVLPKVYANIPAKLFIGEKSRTWYQAPHAVKTSSVAFARGGVLVRSQLAAFVVSDLYFWLSHYG